MNEPTQPRRISLKQPPDHGLGKWMAARRREAELSQMQLAQEAGLSQSMISRMEGSESLTARNLHTVKQITASLSASLGDIASLGEFASEDLIASLEREASSALTFGKAQRGTRHFVAYCPNVDCLENKFTCRKNISGKAYTYFEFEFLERPAEEFHDTNFCPSCATRLVKNCGNCQLPLANRWAEFCTKCGDPVKPQISEKDHERLEASGRDDPDPDPPF